MNDTQPRPLHDLSPDQVKIELSGLTAEQRVERLKIQDAHGNTALHSSYTKETSVLLEGLTTEQRFDLLKIKNNNGRTPLHFAYDDAIHLFLKGLSPKQRLDLLKIKDNDGCTPIVFRTSQDINAFLEGLSEEDCLKIVPTALGKMIWKGLNSSSEATSALTSRFTTAGRLSKVLFTRSGYYRFGLYTPECEAINFMKITKEIRNLRDRDILNKKFMAAAQKALKEELEDRTVFLHEILSSPPAATPGGQ